MLANIGTGQILRSRTGMRQEETEDHNRIKSSPANADATLYATTRPTCAPEANPPATATGEKGHAMRAMLHTVILLGLLAATTPATAEAPGHAEPHRVVYFQVSYTNGTVRDLSRVPIDDKGIARVTRITRIAAAGHGTEILSTHGRPLRSVNTGRTVRVNLGWNGKAWVGPKPAPAATAKTAPPTAAKMTPARRQEIVNTERLLATLRRLDKRYAARQTEATEALKAATDAKAKAAAVEALTKAKAAGDNCARTIAQAEKHLADLLAGKAPAPPGAVAGQLDQADETPRAANLIRPAEDSAVLPHRVQVWPLAPGQGKRTYRVSMAHTEAGICGAFYYVAYADTTADGVPDTLVARSPLARVDRPGGWTVWTFETDAARVFVGNTWPRDDTTQFRRTRPRRGATRDGSGLPEEIYVSGFFGQVPTKKHAFWPYLHNIRVQLRDDKHPTHRTNSKIIMRQR